MDPGSSRGQGTGGAGAGSVRSQILFDDFSSVVAGAAPAAPLPPPTLNQDETEVLVFEPASAPAPPDGGGGVGGGGGGDERTDAIVEHNAELAVVPNSLFVGSERPSDTERTFHVFGAPGYGDAGDFTRKMYGRGFTAPRGVHMAHYVRLSFRLTEKRTAWLVCEPHCGGNRNALWAALRTAFPAQPSVDCDPVQPRVYLDDRAGHGAFNAQNAIILGYFLERCSLAGAATDVGVRLGMYVTPDSDVPVDEQPAPTPAAVSKGLRGYPALVHDMRFGFDEEEGGNENSKPPVNLGPSVLGAGEDDLGTVPGDAEDGGGGEDDEDEDGAALITRRAAETRTKTRSYTFIAHAGDSCTPKEWPVRLGPPQFTAWSHVYQNTTSHLTEDELWDVSFPNSDDYVKRTSRLTRFEGPPHAGPYDAAESRLPHYSVTLFQPIRMPNTNAVFQELTVYAVNPKALRAAHLRYESYVREEMRTNPEFAKRLPVIQAHKQRPYWLVVPATAKHLARWSDLTKFPERNDDRKFGVRTLTELEDLLLKQMTGEFASNHGLRSLFYEAQTTTHRVLVSTGASVNGQTMHSARYHDIREVIQMHADRVQKNKASNQMKDATRLAATAHPMDTKSPFTLDLEIGVLIAPLALSRGPNTTPLDDDRTGEPVEMRFVDGAYWFQTQSGRRRGVVPLTNPGWYLDTLAWERVRSPGSSALTF